MCLCFLLLQILSPFRAKHPGLPAPLHIPAKPKCQSPTNQMKRTPTPQRHHHLRHRQLRGSLLRYRRAQPYHGRQSSTLVRADAPDATSAKRCDGIAKNESKASKFPGSRQAQGPMPGMLASRPSSPKEPCHSILSVAMPAPTAKQRSGETMCHPIMSTILNERGVRVAGREGQSASVKKPIRRVRRWKTRFFFWGGGGGVVQTGAEGVAKRVFCFGGAAGGERRGERGRYLEKWGNGGETRKKDDLHQQTSPSLGARREVAWHQGIGGGSQPACDAPRLVVPLDR